MDACDRRARSSTPVTYCGRGRSVEIKFERYIVQGTVVMNRRHRNGAAIDVGGSTVFPLAWSILRSTVEQSCGNLRVLVEFLTGRFEVVSAPGDCEADRARERAGHDRDAVSSTGPRIDRSVARACPASGA
jgi:hypothetical protein